MDYSDCDSSCLDSPNSSWSMARLKEYLRRKKRPSKRGKKPSFLNVIISTDIVTSNPSLFFFCSSFFFLFILFFSLPLLLVMHHTSHLQERSPTCIALLFLQSCLNAHCVLAYIACWPLERRILHELYFVCAATFRVPPVFDREWFHHLANGSQLHAFSQGCAFLCFVVHADSIGDRRTETSSYGRKKKKKKEKKKKKKHRWHCICFQEATSFPCFAMIRNGRVHRLLGTRRKVKIFRRKRSLHRTVLSLTWEFALSSRRRATNQCLLSSLDSGKLW